jgi:hypothetical protein
LEAGLRDPGWQANQRKATILGSRLKPELQLSSELLDCVSCVFGVG